MSPSSMPFTVLTLDGGGMRGLYAASVLRALESRFLPSSSVAKRSLDIGTGFDLVVGTSTGGLLAAAIVAGVPMRQLVGFFKDHGPKVFPTPRPANARTCLHYLRRACRPDACPFALRTALDAMLNDETFGGVYRRRKIALCLTATDILSNRPRVFKTPHLIKKDMDNDVSLADACMATTAAPTYFPIAPIESSTGSRHYYADGGLWANNPVLVGLVEAISMSDPERPITIVSVGSCAPPPGSEPPANLNAGFRYWLPDRLLTLGMNSQAMAAQYYTEHLANALTQGGRDVKILRCKETPPSSKQEPLLRLDSASSDAITLMATLGAQDGNMTYRWTQSPNCTKGTILQQIFDSMEEITTYRTTGE